MDHGEPARTNLVLQVAREKVKAAKGCDNEEYKARPQAGTFAFHCLYQEQYESRRSEQAVCVDNATWGLVPSHPVFQVYDAHYGGNCEQANN